MERILNPQFEIELKLMLEAINLKYDYDFRHYSPASMKRTMVHAMERMGCGTLPILQKKILQDSDFFHDLIESLTIPVSEMFRDPTYFLALRQKVFPLLKTYPSLKVWVAGCSTGEEVYSLAILLQEEGLLSRTTLYATDINPRSLEKAEKGVFKLKMIQSFAENYQKSGGKRSLSDYYTATDNLAKFKSILKKKITFADHSLVTDAVFMETQLISCRNVLIYFDRELQDRAFGLFHESLCRKGFLGVGAKETIQFSQYAKYFDPFVKKDRIFQKK
ncbi:MAG: protein-glutamate O-methyltransferase CheR [Deltaproteobacteria bacterium]|nr:protein-glutamate O-methyltransferase CheR [Deltaproteobacteria bacterium]